MNVSAVTAAATDSTSIVEGRRDMPLHIFLGVSDAPNHNIQKDCIDVHNIGTRLISVLSSWSDISLFLEREI